MAENDDLVEQIRIEGLDSATKQMDQLGEAGAKAFEKIGESVNRTNASLRKLAGFEKDIDKVALVSNQLGLAIRGVGKAIVPASKEFARFGNAAAAAIGGVTIATTALVRRAAQLAETIRDGAVAAGTSQRAYQELAFAATQSGANLQRLGAAMAVLNTGTEETEKQIANLGVRLKNANGSVRDSTTVFKEIAQAISEIEDPAERASRAANIFGRRLGPELVELLSQGQEGIEKLGQEAQRAGLILDEATVKVGTDFTSALDKVLGQASILGTRLALAFGPALISLFDALGEAIIAITPTLLAVASGFAKALQAVISFVTQALTPFQLGLAAIGISLASLVAGIGAVASALGPVMGLLKVFSAPFTIGLKLITSGFALVLKNVTLLTSALRFMGIVSTAAFGPWGIAIAAVAAALSFLLVLLFQNFDWAAFAAEGTAVWTQITEAVTQFAEDVAAIFVAVVGWAQEAWNSIRQAAINAWNSISTAASEAFAPVLSAIDDTINRIKSLIEWAKKAASALASIFGGGGGGGDGAAGFARGGKVRGPGTSTSDSIPALLSNGEYVARARAVRYYGAGLFEALNKMRLPRDFVGRFAEGGLASMSRSLGPIPRFANGGMVQAPAATGRPINLSIDGEQFNLIAPDNETGERVIRYAVTRKARAAGRKPSYYGGK